MDDGQAQAEDEAIVARLKSGDPRALAALYDRYGSLMLGLGCKMLRSREEAEDVLHDVFMEAWRKVDTYDPQRGTVRAWLVLRMRSRVLDRIRSPARKRASSTEEVTEAASPDLISAAPEAPRLRSEQEKMKAALEALSDDLRAVVQLVYFQGCSVAQASEKLEVPAGTVKSRLFAARGKLRDALAPVMEGA